MFFLQKNCSWIKTWDYPLLEKSSKQDFQHENLLLSTIWISNLTLLKSVIWPKHITLPSHILLERITPAGSYQFAVRRKQFFFAAILFSTILMEQKYTYLSHSSQNTKERNARMEEDRKSTRAHTGTQHLPLVTAEAKQVPPTAGLAPSDVGQQGLLQHVCIASHVSYLHSSPQPEQGQHMVL